MSCKECEEIQSKGWIAFYRWGRANIGLLACQEHAMQIIGVLNAAQKIGGDNPIKKDDSSLGKLRAGWIKDL